MNTSLEELKKNSECIEGSFIYSLHEKDYFNEELFWKYYNSIYQLSNYYRDKEYNIEVTKMIIHTYNYFLKSLIWHLSPNDMCKINNIPIEKLHLIIERLSVRVEYGYFGRENINEDDLNEELINPNFKQI